ncbi:MAG: hypothetical protein LBC13_01320, partial [Clostridiales bacterium]|nr:hypothetical protein [Clostridiales bacterium]
MIKLRKIGLGSLCGKAAVQGVSSFVTSERKADGSDGIYGETAAQCVSGYTSEAERHTDGPNGLCGKAAVQHVSVAAGKVKPDACGFAAQLKRAAAVLCAVFFCVTAIMLTACGSSLGKSQDDIMEYIKSRGYICASVKTNVPGFSKLINPSLPTYEGFEIDLIYMIAADIFDVTAYEARLQKFVRFANLDESHREVSLENG